MKISSCQNFLEHKCRLFCIPFLFNVRFPIILALYLCNKWTQNEIAIKDGFAYIMYLNHIKPRGILAESRKR